MLTSSHVMMGLTMKSFTSRKSQVCTVLGKFIVSRRRKKRYLSRNKNVAWETQPEKPCNGFLHTRKNKNNTMSYESNGGNKYKCRLLINNSCSRSFKCQLSRKKARSNGLRAIKDVCSKHFYRGQLNVVFE